MILFTFLLVLLAFFIIFDVNIIRTEYPTHDFPLVILLIVLANLYYLTYYLWLAVKHSREYFKSAPIPEPEMKEITSVKGIIYDKEMYFANTSSGIIVVPQDQIAVIFRQGDYVLLRTFERETYTLENSIPQVYLDLNSDHFFKINPRYIVSYPICKSFKTGTYGKLDLQLGSPMHITESVSRTLVSDFEKWMMR
jgi:hypothetical protein